MKSPAALQHKLTQAWHKDKTRLARLCTDAFPITLALGLPKTADIGSAAVRMLLERWHDFARHNIGTILWQEKKYQACFAPIACPTHWQIHDLSEWQAAMDNVEAQTELGWFIAFRATRPAAHPGTIRRAGQTQSASHSL